MKKYLTLCVAAATLASCSKDWTEPDNQGRTETFENVALSDLKEKRDQFKWVAEAERIGESELARQVYFEQLREYKANAWLNTGEAGGQTPFFYFWYSSDAWVAEPGIAKSWLQSLPDSLTAISMWGGLAMRPSTITENQKKDLEIFHEKGGTVLMCWQTSGPGLGLPKSLDGTLNGWDDFRAKYPFETEEAKWSEYYARDLARYIIALNFDGYDVDWETCGDHGTVTREGQSLMVSTNGYENISKFVKEIAKYFGPFVSGEERKKNLEALFNPDTEGFHPKEREYIDDFKPHLPANWLEKRYYLVADIPCGVAPIFGDNFALYFEKHFMQDYTVSGVGTHIRQLGGKYFNSTSANYQSGGYNVIPGKARAVANRQIWGFGAYHGQTDFDNTHDTDSFKNYLRRNNLTRKYNTYAWTREAMRIADPRPYYSNFNEMDQVIITP
ncbi:MAG: hypothetical protein Q4G08_06915 [Capnocytophaga sp.]|nr:hypothetical protein [Capnocytophaga sp.]